MAQGSPGSCPDGHSVQALAVQTWAWGDSEVRVLGIGDPREPYQPCPRYVPAHDLLFPRGVPAWVVPSPPFWGALMLSLQVGCLGFRASHTCRQVETPAHHLPDLAPAHNPFGLATPPTPQSLAERNRLPFRG